MTDSRRRPALVGVRCTPDEHADIHRTAAGRGQSASAYLRDLHEQAKAERVVVAVGVVHRAPDGGISPFNCCGLHPPAVPDTDRITWSDHLVTCEGG